MNILSDRNKIKKITNDTHAIGIFVKFKKQISNILTNKKKISYKISTQMSYV